MERTTFTNSRRILTLQKTRTIIFSKDRGGWGGTEIGKRREHQEQTKKNNNLLIVISQRQLFQV